MRSRRRQEIDLPLRHPRADWPSRRASSVLSRSRSMLPQLPGVLDATAARRRPCRRRARRAPESRSGARARRTTGSTRAGASIVRNGTIRSRGTSRPRLVTRCRRLSSSSRADGAVGEEDERALPREPPDGVVGVDPRVHALARRRARRAAAAARRAKTEPPERRAVRRSGRKDIGNWELWIRNWQNACNGHASRIPNS